MVKFFSLSLIVLLFSSLNKVHASQYRMYDCDNLDKSYACGSGCKISYNSFKFDVLDSSSVRINQYIQGQLVSSSIEKCDVKSNQKFSCKMYTGNFTIVNAIDSGQGVWGRYSNDMNTLYATGCFKR
tara:strand:- start:36 stop:416 length:381 start_codon:yes stop_codon:yes gene_type:complete